MRRTGIRVIRSASGGSRAQSAMEYLMTYGWAILIIAVALAVIYYFGVLTPSSFVGQQCLLPSGLSCTVVGMATNGLLTLNLFQNTQSQINVTAIGCNSTYAFPSSIVVSYAVANQISIPSGSNATLAVPCYSGSAAFGGVVGSEFTGYVMVNYAKTYVGLPHSTSGTVIAKVSHQ